MQKGGTLLAEARRIVCIAPAAGHAGRVIDSSVTDTEDSVAIVSVVDALVVVRSVVRHTGNAGLNAARLR